MDTVAVLKGLRDRPCVTEEERKALDEAILFFGDAFVMAVEHSRETMPKSHPAMLATVDE